MGGPACTQDVNQETGEDLNPNRRRTLDAAGGDGVMRNPDRPIEAVMLEMQEDPSDCKRLTKITDLEKWEIKQVFFNHFLTFHPLGMLPRTIQFILKMFHSDDRSQRTA